MADTYSCIIRPVLQSIWTTGFLPIVTFAGSISEWLPSSYLHWKPPAVLLFPFDWRTVFIEPSLARVGLSETEAIEKGYEIKVAKLPVASIPMARVIGEIEGVMKAVVDANTNKILGCTLLCAQASEIINIVSTAINTGQDYTFLRDNIFTHPTMSEALNDLFSLI